MGYGALFGYIIGIVVLYFLGKYLIFPMKIVVKLIYYLIIGGILIAVLNLIGNYLKFNIALNPFTAITAGMLGVPGIVLLFILKSLV